MPAAGAGAGGAGNSNVLPPYLEGGHILTLPTTQAEPGGGGMPAAGAGAGGAGNSNVLPLYLEGGHILTLPTTQAEPGGGGMPAAGAGAGGAGNSNVLPLYLEGGHILTLPTTQAVPGGGGMPAAGAGAGGAGNNNVSPMYLEGGHILTLPTTQAVPGGGGMPVAGAGAGGAGNNNVSPLLPRRPVLLEFSNITCSISRFSLMSLAFEPQQILKGVDGCFRPGELTAIMGPSGAGKTTLLNILAGYTTRGAGGQVCVNGAAACAAQSGGRGGARYIRQRDELRAHLTVGEAMALAAALKLADFTKNERREKVHEILALLGLTGAARTLCRDLSGGQRRRLAVALELLSDPSLLFLDEPTTGLDSSASASLVALLSGLARGGRTLVATIHQPSALLFERLDAVHCLSAGRTLYRGPRAGLLPALSSAGLACPPYHNPADFLMEVASGEYNVDLVKLATCMAQREERVYPTATAATPPWESPTIPAIQYPEGNGCTYSKHTIVENSKHQLKSYGKNIYRQSGLLRQTWILLYRNYLMTTRNYSLYMWRLVAHVGIALLFGYLYSGVGADADRVLANYVYLYGSMLLVVYTGKMSVTLSFPMEMEILRGEHFNRWYNLGPYIVSILAVELPFQMLSCVSYVLLSYWLTDNPLEPSRAALFLATVVATSLCAQSWGYFIGSTTPTRIAVFLGPIIAVLFSVFGFCIGLANTPMAFRWLHHISYFRAGFHVAVHSVYGLNRTKLHCPPHADGFEYCHFQSPRQFLTEMDITEVDIAGNMTLVVVTMFVMHLLTSSALWWRLNKR